MTGQTGLQPFVGRVSRLGVDVAAADAVYCCLRQGCPWSNVLALVTKGAL